MKPLQRRLDREKIETQLQDREEVREPALAERLPYTNFPPTLDMDLQGRVSELEDRAMAAVSLRLYLRLEYLNGRRNSGVAGRDSRLNRYVNDTKAALKGLDRVIYGSGDRQEAKPGRSVTLRDLLMAVAEAVDDAWGHISDAETNRIATETVDLDKIVDSMLGERK